MNISGYFDRCGKVRRFISDRIDSPLPSWKQRLVERHLSTCARCRQEEADYRKIKGVAATMETYTPPEYLWDRIIMRLDEHPWGGEEYSDGPHSFKNPGIPLRGRIRLAGAALMFALIALLTLFPGDSNIQYPQNQIAQATEKDTPVELVSLYMSANTDHFPPEIREYYINQFIGLDQKIRMIKSAMGRFPQNPVIRTQLAQAYYHKLALYHKLGIMGTDDLEGPADDFAPFERGDHYE